MYFDMKFITIKGYFGKMDLLKKKREIYFLMFLIYC